MGGRYKHITRLMAGRQRAATKAMNNQRRRMENAILAFWQKLPDDLRLHTTTADVWGAVSAGFLVWRKRKKVLILKVQDKHGITDVEAVQAFLALRAIEELSKPQETVSFGRPLFLGNAHVVGSKPIP